MFNWQDILKKLLTVVVGALLAAFGSGLLIICYQPPGGHTLPPPVVPCPPRPEPPVPPLPIPPPKPTPPPDVKKSLGSYRTSSSGCSLTVIGPRASDGYYYALSSAHCFRSGSRSVTIAVGGLKDVSGEAVHLNPDADLALIRFKTTAELTYALLSKAAPAKGDTVWHQGFGIHVPGNVERGKIIDPGAPGRAQSHSVSLSAGDSGSGLLDTSDRLVGVNHSTGGGRSYASSWFEVRDFLGAYHPDAAAKPYQVSDDDGPSLMPEII